MLKLLKPLVRSLPSAPRTGAVFVFLRLEVLIVPAAMFYYEAAQSCNRVLTQRVLCTVMGDAP